MAVFSSNTSAVSTHTRLLEVESQALVIALEDFIATSNRRVSKMHAQAENFQKGEMASLSANSGLVEEHISRIHDALQLIQAKEKASDESLSTVRSTIKEAHENIAKGFSNWSLETMKTVESMCVQIEESGKHSCTMVSGLSSKEKLYSSQDTKG